MNLFRSTLAAALFLAASLAPLPLSAQNVGITRHDLQRHRLSAPDREVVQVLVRFAPGASAAAHHHPGEEIVYVTEGVLEYRLAGRAPVVLRAGEVLFIPHGVDHEVLNLGDGPAAELATYVVETGRPLVVPAR
jgi:quercetin dioxygenase-like cupin family protein